MVECCNTPDVTFHICNSNSCHFRLCVMIFPPWSGFVFRFAFCSCHASHIMSSCASHLHTCSSHASEHFPRCPFRNPTLPHAPAHPSCLFSCAGVKHSRNGPSLAKWPWYTTGRPPVKFRSIWRPFDAPMVNWGTIKASFVCSSTPHQSGPITHPNPLHALGRSITIVWAKTAPHLDSPNSPIYVNPLFPEISGKP